MSPWTPVCEVCHGRPKMDRSVCCEGCFYSGRYARWADRERRRREAVHPAVAFYGRGTFGNPRTRSVGGDYGDGYDG